MEVFADYLARIDNPEHRARVEEVLRWIATTFPQLAPRIAWNQPMFTDHGTYIIGLSVSRNHLAVAPERVAVDRFEGELAQAGYSRTKELIRIPWNRSVDYGLLQSLIEFNTRDKADVQTFWRR